MKTKTRNLLRGLKKPAAVVLGISSQTGLSIIRSLGAHDIAVIGIDNFGLTMGAFSRYCTSTEITRDENELYELLQHIGQASGLKNIIFCESDKYLLFTDKYKNELQKYFYLPGSLNISLTEIMNKKNMVQLAKSAGLDIPKTFFSGETSPEEIKKNIYYPCIVKPLYTQSWLRRKGEVVLSEKGLDTALAEKRFEKGYLVQEVVAGPETDIWICTGYAGSTTKIFFTGHKIRQIPKQFGVTTAAISEHNEEIEKLSGSFLSHIGYIGIFDVEFKKDAKNGKYKFIELNPRICGFNEMAVSAGINIPYIAYSHILNNRIDKYVETKRTVLWISILDDFITCLKYYSKENKAVLFNWFRTVFKADSHAIFKINDPRPFVFNFFQHLPFPRPKSGYKHEKIF